MQRMEGSITATLREHIGQIAHIQIADVPGRNQPGTGELNYPFILHEIQALGYGGYVGLKYFAPGHDTAASLEWLPRVSVVVLPTNEKAQTKVSYKVASCPADASLSCGLMLLVALLGWTFFAPKRAKDATITGFGAQAGMAVRTFVIELAAFGRHGFFPGKTTHGTRDNGLQVRHSIGHGDFLDISLYRVGRFDRT